MTIMKKLLLLFCLAMSMLTQASAQGNNPYVLHIYDGRTFTDSEKDLNDENLILSGGIMTITDEPAGAKYSRFSLYSPGGKLLFVFISRTLELTGKTINLESGVTVADNYGISFTDPEMKSFIGTFLDGYTGVVIDFSKDNLAVNADNFPDENFRVCLQSESYGWDYVLTPEEISVIKSLHVSNNGITSLKGIEYFTALTELVCYETQLTSLDVSKNTALEFLQCPTNLLTSLDVSKNTALEYLDCSNNQLTSLDVSKNTALTDLICYGNQLTSLDVSKNTALTTLYCGYNKLTSLDVSKNTALTELVCYENQLTSLDVLKNTALTTLSCGYNELTSLDVSKNTALEFLDCSNNQLTSLDVSKNTALTEFYCSLNQIKGAQAEALVNSLPKVTDGKLYFCDPTDAAEKNEITDAQVAKAKDKGWTVMAWNGSGWSEYAGTTGIGNVEQAEPGAVRTYTLDGRPLSGQPAKPGIYIRSGKKVIVK